jgi:outer membrane protein assembly factor BamB
VTRLFAVTLAAVTAAAAPAADWPQWRGPDRTGISKETGLLKAWPADGPKLRWKITDLGTGYSSPVVVKGVVYVQTTRGPDEFVVALDEKTGKEAWATKIGLVGKNQGPQYPGTRATPTVDGDTLYCLASDGELNAVGTDGKVKWHKNLKAEFAGEVGFWAYTESVLIDGDKLICTPGGKTATLAALKKADGSVVWKSEVPGGDVADYASIMAVTGGGKKQYVQYLRKALVGVDAETGKFLWKYTRTQDQGASVLTPVVSDGKVFVAGSRTGGGLVKLEADGGGVKATEVFFEKAYGPSMGGAILVDGSLYFTAGSGGGAKLYCVDFATGKEKWKEACVGSASLCVADGMLYARGWNGDLALVEVNPEKYVEKGRFKQPFKTKTQGWPHPVVANGGFYVRDMDTLLCFDVTAGK